MSRGGVLRLFDRIVMLRLGQVSPLESLSRRGVSFLVSRGHPVVDSGVCEIKRVQYGNIGVLGELKKNRNLPRSKRVKSLLV